MADSSGWQTFKQGCTSLFSWCGATFFWWVPSLATKLSVLVDVPAEFTYFPFCASMFLGVAAFIFVIIDPNSNDSNVRYARYTISCVAFCVAYVLQRRTDNRHKRWEDNVAAILKFIKNLDSHSQQGTNNTTSHDPLGSSINTGNDSIALALRQKEEIVGRMVNNSGMVLASSADSVQVDVNTPLLGGLPRSSSSDSTDRKIKPD